MNTSTVEDLEGSTDQPKSKLDNPDYVEQRKMMDLESPISPGRERSLEPEEGQDIDLKVEITGRLKHTTGKNDSYISYKINTNVRIGRYYLHLVHVHVVCKGFLCMYGMWKYKITATWCQPSRIRPDSPS